MKPILFYLERYKLLKNFTVNFSKDISILVGINCFVKSTIIEAIVQIFSNVVINEKSKLISLSIPYLSFKFKQSLTTK
jgi:hypothetical protein